MAFLFFIDSIFYAMLDVLYGDIWLCIAMGYMAYGVYARLLVWLCITNDPPMVNRI